MTDYIYPVYVEGDGTDVLVFWTGIEKLRGKYMSSEEELRRLEVKLGG